MPDIYEKGLADYINSVRLGDIDSVGGDLWEHLDYNDWWLWGDSRLKTFTIENVVIVRDYGENVLARLALDDKAEIYKNPIVAPEGMKI